MRYLEEQAVSTLSPQDFRARFVLTVLLIHLKLFFLNNTEREPREHAQNHSQGDFVWKKKVKK